MILLIMEFEYTFVSIYDYKPFFSVSQQKNHAGVPPVSTRGVRSTPLRSDDMGVVDCSRLENITVGHCARSARRLRRHGGRDCEALKKRGFNLALLVIF
jgi:hypothetical protein